MGIYYSSQFAPLVVFFLLFLSVVKNTKLHHFVRFNAMQVCTSRLQSCIFACQANLGPVNVDLTSMQITWRPVMHIGTVMLIILDTLLVISLNSALKAALVHMLSRHPT